MRVDGQAMPSSGYGAGLFGVLCGACADLRRQGRKLEGPANPIADVLEGAAAEFLGRTHNAGHSVKGPRALLGHGMEADIAPAYSYAGFQFAGVVVQRQLRVPQDQQQHVFLGPRFGDAGVQIGVERLCGEELIKFRSKAGRQLGGGIGLKRQQFGVEIPVASAECLQRL